MADARTLWIFLYLRKIRDRLLDQFEIIGRRWNAASLATQFFAAGGLVLLIATLAIGSWVTSQIKEGVMRNSAATTALYVDSVIAPLLPDLRKGGAISYSTKRVLDETLGQGGLGRRLVGLTLWSQDGSILYTKSPAPSLNMEVPKANLAKAFSGVMRTEYPVAMPGQPYSMKNQNLLAIYNPVRAPWTGEVVAVSELYEAADEFEATLRSALRWSWMVVAGVTAMSLVALSGIVFRGSRTIDRQRRSLTGRVSQLQDLVAQNRNLRLSVQAASQKSSALNEHYLRRIGADLHDGPAQLVAFALLRLDAMADLKPRQFTKRHISEIESIQISLADAMREIRDICRGLVLPQIEAISISEILLMATSDHEQRTRSAVKTTLPQHNPDLGTSEKICIYRFIQEGLNNAFKHAQARAQEVKAVVQNGVLSVEVSDQGPGFDPTMTGAKSLGLAGLRERVGSIGGLFEVLSSAQGTRLIVILPLEERT